MAVDTPRKGRCNAQLANGRFCGIEPAPGATRCISHGGFSQQIAGMRENLYSNRLRQSFKRPEDQRLYEEMPKSTDLSEEIRLARMNVVRYQEMIENGTDVIFVKDKRKPLASQIAEGSDAQLLKEEKIVALNVHDLLRDALANLRALAVSQDAIHPGSDIGGNLRLTITLAGTKKERPEIPDLTGDANAQNLLPATGSVIDVDPVRSGGSTGYEDDDA